MKIIILFAAFIHLLIGDLFSQPNCSAPSTGFNPINDLGTGISPVTGLMGGLYPNGSNFLPSAHKTSGLQLAMQVQCLDTSGNPDAVNGKVVWLSIGMSNCSQETQQFIPLANALVGKNPNLTLVNGAQGGKTAEIVSSPWNSSYTNFWNTVDARLSSEGVTANQVQVIWFKEANKANLTPPVQDYHDSLVVQIKRIMNEIKTRFPNVKLCYLASRISARYASTALNPEPYAYMTGWAVKKVIEDQINGDAQLAYSGSGAKSPWLSWGIYMWSDGDTPQMTNSNIFFTCTDYQNDGTHPSTAGEQKIGGLLLDFFSTDSTATPWFIANGCNTTGIEKQNLENSLHIYPNPFCLTTTLQVNEDLKNATLIVYNSFGQQVKQIKNISGQTVTFHRENLVSGLYFIQLTQDNKVISSNNLVISN